MTDVPTTPPPAADDRRDPVTGLRRMSKTAGVGMNDYAAVSTLAVVALVLGLASPLVFLGPLAMIVPLAGVVVAVAAVVAVRGSNGTQTGLPLAVVGGLLSAGLLGWYVTQTLATGRLDAGDQREVQALVAEFAEDVRAKDYAAAYGLFHERFREVVPPDRFESALVTRQENPFYGEFQDVTLSDVVRFETDPALGGRVAASLLVVELPPAPTPPGTTRPAEGPPERYDRPAVTFREEGGQWRFLNVPDWFAPPEPRQ